ncbi:MAG: 16S rRNA (adenine(1518)-N(6)/adenine(1519)-N(6))-dimethyltransferase RsmA [Candidatus Aminicenantes bacterium]
MNKGKRKAYGQHFLVDRKVLRKIVTAIHPCKQDLIIEIGAGKGALTFPLAKKAGKIIAVEKEKSFIPFLERKKLPHLVILREDVLKIDFRELVEKEKHFFNNAKLVGNLPYSISSPLLFKLFDHRGLFSWCVFLLQKEVAERIDAEPGTKKYAPLSILFQIYFFTKTHFTVPPRSFSPPPQVDSALISLKKRSSPLFPVKNDQLFLNFLKGAFRHRRKMLLNNLKMLHFPSSLVEEAFQKYQIESHLRPEQLSISKFVSLFNFFYPQSSGHSARKSDG